MRDIYSRRFVAVRFAIYQIAHIIYKGCKMMKSGCRKKTKIDKKTDRSPKRLAVFWHSRLRRAIKRIPVSY